MIFKYSSGGDLGFLHDAGVASRIGQTSTLARNREYSTSSMAASLVFGPAGGQLTQRKRFPRRWLETFPEHI
jgi:hypothetical protein